MSAVLTMPPLKRIARTQPRWQCRILFFTGLLFRQYELKINVLLEEFGAGI
jgi:hypothetical protein